MPKTTKARSTKKGTPYDRRSLKQDQKKTVYGDLSDLEFFMDRKNTGLFLTVMKGYYGDLGMAEEELLEKIAEATGGSLHGKGCPNKVLSIYIKNADVTDIIRYIMSGRFARTVEKYGEDVTLNVTHWDEYKDERLHFALSPEDPRNDNKRRNPDWEKITHASLGKALFSC